MGKSKKPKVEVTEYSMSEHFGICSGPIDALLGIIIKEKTAWTGELIEQASFNIDQPELFGGIKKEGGLVGKVHFFRGESSQLLTDNLAQKLGRPDGANCPAFRGLASIFFYGKTGNEGFLWSANTPFLPGVWARIQRIFKTASSDDQWYAEKAGIPSLAYTIAETIALPETTTFKYKIVDASDDTDFSDPDLDDSDWDVGQGPFGDRPHPSVQINDWADPNTTVPNSPLKAVWLRYSGLDSEIDQIVVAADNIPTLYINGASVPLTPSGEWLHFANVAPVPASRLALRVEDTGPVGETNYVYAGVRGVISASTIYDMNPAHIIRECLTDVVWGMGTPSSAVDDTAFTQAADTLFAEGFGLSMIWTRQASIQDFVQEVLDHIQGVLFVDPSTGLLTLKLIRGDYDAETLPVITPDNADLTSFSRKLWGDIVNEIVVTWTNPENEQEETITAQDLASISTQGGIVSDSRNYYGVRNPVLAQNLAYRDLRSAGQPLATCEAEVDRTQWRLRPASVLKLTWPEYSVSELVMRVTSIDYGKPGDPTIKLSLMEDVYGLDVGSYDAPPTTEWVDPTSEPTPIETVEIFTLPLFFAADTTVAAFVDSPEYPEVLAGILATTDNTDTFEYELWDDVTLANGGASTEAIATNNIIGRGVLAADLDAEALSAAVSFDSIVGQTFPTVGGFAIIGDEGEAGNEIVLIDTGDYDLIRGVLDTVPRAWPAGTPVWFVDGSTLFEDPLVRSAGETVDYKLLPRTSQGLLPYGTAPFESATLTERPWLPNRPANVQVNGVGWSSPSDVINAVGATVTVIWANRNRLMEDSQVLSWTDSTMTPEAGQTTLIEVLDPDENLLTTHSGLTGTTFVVPGPDYDGIVRLRVWSERTDDDGYFQSLQYFEHWVLVATSTLLATPDDELNEPQFILLSGDATDGDDKIELSGDAA